MLDLAQQFWKQDSGGASIEYALVAAGVSVGIVIAVGSAGSKLKSTFALLGGAPRGAASDRPAVLQDGP
jgi:Flp pilus assembly pilin Flp